MSTAEYHHKKNSKSAYGQFDFTPLQKDFEKNHLIPLKNEQQKLKQKQIEELSTIKELS